MFSTVDGLRFLQFARFPKSSEGEERYVVPILECGEAVFWYTIPSFSVITVKLRKNTFQCFVPEDSGDAAHPAVRDVHGFIKDHPSLDMTYPAEITVGYSGDEACLVVYMACIITIAICRLVNLRRA